MTTPADELRAAAEKLRKLATHPDVTPGPWLCLDGGDRIIHDGPGIEFGPADYVVDEPVNNSANAELIAAMHPGVGTALATLLEDCAELHEANPPHRGQPRPGCQWCADEDFPCADMRNALAVARAINAA